MDQATLSEEETGTEKRIVLDGRLTVRVIEDVSPRLRALENEPQPVTVDLSAVDRIDTTRRLGALPPARAPRGAGADRPATKG